MGRAPGCACPRTNDIGACGVSGEPSPLPPGSQAPDFTAVASDGQTYRLTDLLARGHVALFFYPGNNTPG
jgi:hypothetical protein